MVICPTSEFPICPSGKPTALDEATNDAYGSENNFLNKGVFACVIQFCLGVLLLIQNPSNMIRASFFIAIL